MRKTKIICTIGPATDSLEMLEKLANAGMNVARLNMSHGSHDSHRKVIDAIRVLNRKLNHPIAVLLDTQGPEIRTGDMANDLHLNAGETVSIVARGAEDVESSSIHINYEDLINDILEKNDGSIVQISKCPNNYGKIKSPICCGADMSCSVY